jgi:hypothetical protein
MRLMSISLTRKNIPFVSDYIAPNILTSYIKQISKSRFLHKAESGHLYNFSNLVETPLLHFNMHNRQVRHANRLQEVKLYSSIVGNFLGNGAILLKNNLVHIEGSLDGVGLLVNPLQLFQSSAVGFDTVVSRVSTESDM